MQPMIICLIAALAVCASQLARADPSQQQQQQQTASNQQRSRASGAALASSDQGAQNSYGGSEYLVGNSLISLDLPQSLGTKRARKMSAFMPMRGRKDGRDELRIASMYGQSAPEVEGDLAAPLIGPLREQDGETSILRLVAANGQPLGLATTYGGQDLATRLRWVAGVPHQFIDQVQQQQLRQPMARQSASAPESPYGGAGSGSSGEMLEQLANMDNGAAPAPLMQAKLRRAFHPMRGKKSMGAAQMDAGELLALLEDM